MCTFSTASIVFAWMFFGSTKGQSEAHRGVQAISLDVRIHHKMENNSSVSLIGKIYSGWQGSCICLLGAVF